MQLLYGSKWMIIKFGFKFYDIDEMLFAWNSLGIDMDSAIPWTQDELGLNWSGQYKVNFSNWDVKFCDSGECHGLWFWSLHEIQLSFRNCRNQDEKTKIRIPGWPIVFLPNYPILNSYLPNQLQTFDKCFISIRLTYIWQNACFFKISGT